AFNAVFAIQLAHYLAACALIWRGAAASRRGLLGVIGFALVFRLALVPTQPLLSDDVYRYVWDGRVQAAGINPYRFVPADDALAPLRDAEVYPKINRRDYARTIYPPAAQAFFLVTHVVAGDGVVRMKLAAVAIDMLSIGLLVALLRRRRLDPARVAVYAWHPLVVWEFGHSGHVDALAVMLLVGALYALERRRTTCA